MKKIITSMILMGLGYLSQAQVIITEQANPAPTNSSVLLEFGSQPKGIILPSVASAPGAVGGTFIVNTTTKAVQYYNGTGWVNLTDAGIAVANPFVNDGTTDIADGIIIGANTTDKPGALVLESTTQALVLPRVASPQNSILSPVAGTMVYDTDSDALAVYDGKYWAFWAAKESADPPTNPEGEGTLTGRVCFDVVEEYVGPECGELSARLSQKADFSQTSTNTQTYTFTPTGTVSNVRFVYVNTNGQVIQSLTPDADYSGNVSAAATATVVYYNDLNTTAAGLSREDALTADIYVVYNNAANELGTDVQLKLTANVQDCACCGAYVAEGVWKNFMCHNLGADETLDPNIPVVGLQGGYIQWGFKGPADWKTSGNTSRFAAAPTASNSNSGAISSWDLSNPSSTTAWRDASKNTTYDPCPAGWRVPAMTDWYGVVEHNTMTRTGTWTTGATQYGSALHFGTEGGITLTLPAAGERAGGDLAAMEPSYKAILVSRGSGGYYWSSTYYSNWTGGRYLSLSFVFGASGHSADPSNPTTHWNFTNNGMSVRCVQE